MTQKTILGLDLGTNSIGWALVEQDSEANTGKILGMGSRIIPMDQGTIGKFAEGSKISQTADRTKYRSTRRLGERAKLRRSRLLRVLNVIGFLPEHFANEIDFEIKKGQFKSGCEPKIAYDNNGFLFQNSFNEMLNNFKEIDFNGDKKIPYDWTIYHLRKKALTEKINKEELAWLLLNFNQKRGYYQLRGEEEELQINKDVSFHRLLIVDVIADESQKGKGDIWYSVVLDNGWVYRRSSKTPLYDWVGNFRDFIVTTELNEDGSIKLDKEGKERRSFRAPEEKDWTLIKKKTEAEIEKSKKTVGTYIYDNLMLNPLLKIRGNLVRTIERKYYKKELQLIIERQMEFHSELQSQDLLDSCIKELYSKNELHQDVLKSKGFKHLFLNDIIFYQRPLRSKKSLISNCSFESNFYKNENGVAIKIPIKSAPKSHPLYQEFRLWQWISNLKIINIKDDVDVTADFIKGENEIVDLFKYLSNLNEVNQDNLIKYFLDLRGLKGKLLKEEVSKYRWNFVQDKSYPMCETKTKIVSRLKKVEGYSDLLISDEFIFSLWHICYSVTDKTEYEKALKSFSLKHGLSGEQMVLNFKNLLFENSYGSYSIKAIRKLLALMRVGEFYHISNIDFKTLERINRIIDGEFDEGISDRTREKLSKYTSLEMFKGLPLFLASYVAYGRHSEGVQSDKWTNAKDIDNFLFEFKQHSLRNPIVEQVITETLRVVRDIWVHPRYGNNKSGYFSEIHIELGREMKNTLEERQRLTKQVTTSENNNVRIKALLAELLNDPLVENVRPYSPSQQEIMKIYEDGALNSGAEVPEDIYKISTTANPSKTDLNRYKLWLEQKYRSPYTGQIIPLNKLFTSAYEIEHIIPQSRFFDDSFGNKVICESEINKLKGNKLALEFITAHHGEIVSLGYGNSVKVFELEAYKDFVELNYGTNQSRGKRNRLLMDEIPDKMVERQLNDTRYISKYITSILSNIVRGEENDSEFNSKNILPGNGKITNALKQDWGLNDVWNDLILPRFERLNVLTNSAHFTSYNQNFQKYLPAIPLEYSKGFQKKRIDHRHHALDALVIACMSRNHINYLNNLHAIQKNATIEEKQKLRADLRSVLCFKHKIDDKGNYKWMFKKPWNNFTIEAKKNLEQIIVSFKQNLRIINKTVNYYESFKNQNGEINLGKNGLPQKIKIKQTAGQNWAIRKSMHKESAAGIVKLRLKKDVSLSVAIKNPAEIVNPALKKKVLTLQKEGKSATEIKAFFASVGNVYLGVDLSKVGIFYWDVDANGNGLNVASRYALTPDFKSADIDKITDTGIQKILKRHLENYEGKLDSIGNLISPELLAFSPEGIEELNRNIKDLNGGKFHQPIKKVRTFEPKGNRFNVGQSGNNKDKYVIAAQGTNLFFGIYWDKDKQKRVFETIPLNEVIEHQKWRATLSAEERKLIPEIPIDKSKGEFLFYLSPNDLVYVDKLNDEIDANKINKEHIYKIVSFTGNRLYAVPVNSSIAILDKIEFSILNKIEFTIQSLSIKEYCVKLEPQRLGFF